MSFDPHILLTYAVLACVFFILMLDKLKPELVAVGGTAVLLAGGALSTDDVLSVFSSSAPVTIACMFIIAAAMTEAGLVNVLGNQIRKKAGRKKLRGLLALLGFVFVISAFMNNTPTVLILTPVVLSLSKDIKSSSHKYLIPLSYVAVMGGTLTIIGTSTNILVDSIAQDHGLESFYIFEITRPALIMMGGGILFLLLFGKYLLPQHQEQDEDQPANISEDVSEEIGVKEPRETKIHKKKAVISIIVLACVIGLAALDVMPIAGLAFIGAIVILLSGCLTPQQAYESMDWGILMLIFGMLGIGLAMKNTGAAELIIIAGIHAAEGYGPLVLLAATYGLTSFFTETLTNNAVAVIITPLIIGVAESLGLNARPYVVAVMLAASASFATPIGYQTNTYVYKKGNYKFTDFLKIGLPMNLLMLVLATFAIPLFWDLQG